MKYRIESYPHNELLNLAFYNIENLNKKVERNVQEGVELDCLNCIISLAFSVESIVNFIGFHKIDGWNEFERYFKKMNKVCKINGQVFNESIEPFKTLSKLKSLRDKLAHGKPVVNEKEFQVGTPSEIDEAWAPPWNKFIKPDFVNHAYKMVKKFEDDLLEAHGIDPFDSRTKAISL